MRNKCATIGIRSSTSDFFVLHHLQYILALKYIFLGDVVSS